MSRRVLVFAALLAVAAALPLPSYVKQCKLEDPKLSECALKVARETIPNIINGDKKYNIPNLNPLRVTEIKISPGDSLTLVLKDTDIIGIPDVNMKDVKFDRESFAIELHIDFPRFGIVGKYDINGKVLVLPIKGNGDINITLNNVDAVYKVRLDRTKKNDGKEYLSPVDGTLKFNMTQAYIHLDNLFNGDKALGDNTNKFLNENWRDVVQELGPPIGEAISEIISAILRGVLDLVPYEEVFQK